MSAHKFSLTFSARAQRDMDGIMAYTLEHWGMRQLEIYKDKIHKILGAIRENPSKGKQTPYGLQMVLAEKHKIFYLIEGETVFIVRILHQRMDVGRHLQ